MKDKGDVGRKTTLYTLSRPQIVFCSTQFFFFCSCFFLNHPQVRRQQVNAFMNNQVK